MLHSLIFDNFFIDPDSVRRLLLSQDFEDREAPDLVTYPGITDLPPMVEDEMLRRVSTLIGAVELGCPPFARVTHAGMKPPNWAHSDADMGDWAALVYLTPDELGSGSMITVAHRETGLDQTPKTKEELDVLMKDSNKLESWRTLNRCQTKYNRLFLVSTKHLHAALPLEGFGADPATGRLVLTMFLKNLKA